MYIARVELVRLAANGDVLRWFDESAPTGVWTAPLAWTPEAQIAVLMSPAGRWFGWAVENQLVPAWDMSNATFEFCEMCNVDMRRLSLSHAEFRFASLRDADFSGARLDHASFASADCAGADFQGADLSEACLEGTFFRKADLRGANLAGTWAEGADFTDACRWRNDPPIADWFVDDTEVSRRRTEVRRARRR